jgi:hypothetical protein
MIEKVFLYAELDLPPIPEQLLIDAGEPNIVQDSKDIGYGLEHFKNGERIFGLAYKKGIFKHAPLLKWLKDNKIPGAGNTDEVAMQIQTAGTHIIHSDIARIYALNYVIETGGKDVVTRWFQEKNMPLRRSKDRGWKQADTGVVKYDDCQVLGQLTCEKHKWYLIAVDILHDVGVITETRKSISFNFVNPSILNLVKKTNLIKNQND